MVRKRSYPRLRDPLTDPPIYSTGLNKLAKTQHEGKEAYGDAVSEKGQRLGKAPRFFVGLSPPQEIVRSVSYVPPARVIPNSGEISEVLNDMTRDLVISEDEYLLVEEACQLGWSWQRIANELQGRTARQLMKIMADPRARPRMRYDATRAATPSARLPLQRQAVLPAPLAEILGKKTVQTESPSLASPRAKLPPSKPPSLTPRPMSKEDAVVNRRTINRSGGDARVAFQKEIPEPPRGSSVASAHPGIGIAKMKFYEVVHVVDADDQNRVFKFSLQGAFRKKQQSLHNIRPVTCGVDPEHCACFNIGEGKDGSPLLSWSNLFAFYELPDGSKWAEHGYLYDREDLESFAVKNDKEFMHLVPEDLGPQELVKRKERIHSRVQNIEYECWIYKDKLPDDHAHEDDDYFYRVTFDPVTMARIEDC